MLDKSEINVCVVNCDRLDKDPLEYSNSEFENIAKKVGAIYSLDIFEVMFNNCAIDSDRDMIKFIGG